MAYTTPQLLSTTSLNSPLPMFINKSRYCPSNKRQIITCSSSKVPRFGIANAMASKEIMLLSTAQQPYTTTPFHSTTADHQSFYPSCDHLLVVAETIIEHAVHMFDTALLEYLEKLEEKLSKANVFSPLLCTIKQLFTNMDKVVVLSELLLLAERSSITLNLQKMQIIQLCNKRIAAENMKAKYWEEFPETPKEIFKAEASTNKLIEDRNALTTILQWKRFFKELFHLRNEKSQKPMHESYPDFGIGPHAECKYTFYYGSNNKEWTDEFVKKANVLINDQCMKDIQVRIELCCIRDLEKKREEARVFSELINDSGKKVDPHHFLRHDFKPGSDGRFVLIYNLKTVLLDDRGRKILKVLEELIDHQRWKDDVRKHGFEESFIEYYTLDHQKFTGYHD